MTEEPFPVLGLTAEESAALEQLFVQDLPGEKAASINKKVGKSLEKKGYAEPSTIVFKTALGDLKVDTWHITIAGHLAYCSACPEVPDDI